MKNKMLLLTGVLTVTSLLCNCAAQGKEQKTTEQVAADADNLLSELVKLGKDIRVIGSDNQSEIVCACTPVVKPDKTGGPPRSPQEYEAIARALAALEKVAKAESAGQKVEFVAEAAAAPAR
jgi:peptide subunit release factor 1 (eRF1)